LPATQSGGGRYLEPDALIKGWGERRNAFGGVRGSAASQGALRLECPARIDNAELGDNWRDA